jgi:hypothetical protein
MKPKSKLGIVAGAAAIVVAFAVLLAASIALVFATLRIERIASPGAHVIAVCAELIFGAAALLIAVYIAARAAVSAFAVSAAPTAPNDRANSSATSKA